MSVAGVLDVDGTLAARWSLGSKTWRFWAASRSAPGSALPRSLRSTGWRAGLPGPQASSRMRRSDTWPSRSGRRPGLAAPEAAIRAEILAHLGFRQARPQDMRDAGAGTGSELCPLGLPVSGMMERLLGWFVEHRIAAPGEEALGALIVTARRTFEDKVLEAIASSLSSEHRRELEHRLLTRMARPASRI